MSQNIKIVEVSKTYKWIGKIEIDFWDRELMRASVKLSEYKPQICKLKAEKPPPQYRLIYGEKFNNESFAINSTKQLYQNTNRHH